MLLAPSEGRDRSCPGPRKSRRGRGGSTKSIPASLPHGFTSRNRLRRPGSTRRPCALKRSRLPPFLTQGFDGRLPPGAFERRLSRCGPCRPSADKLLMRGPAPDGPDQRSGIPATAQRHCLLPSTSCTARCSAAACSTIATVSSSACRDAVEAAVPAAKVIHVVHDNYASHKHPKVRAWLTRHLRWTFTFTPTSASWLNAVEGFFSTLTRRRPIFRPPSNATSPSPTAAPDPSFGPNPQPPSSTPSIVPLNDPSE